MAYWVDTKTSVAAKPNKDPIEYTDIRWFSDEVGKHPTVPGADWFNMMQGEVLNLLKEAGIDPDKADDAQMHAAITNIINNKLKGRVPEGIKDHFLLGNDKKGYDLKTVEETKEKLGINGLIPKGKDQHFLLGNKKEGYDLKTVEETKTTLDIGANVPIAKEDHFIIGNKSNKWELLNKEGAQELLLPKITRERIGNVVVTRYGDKVSFVIPIAQKRSVSSAKFPFPIYVTSISWTGIYQSGNDAKYDLACTVGLAYANSSPADVASNYLDKAASFIVFDLPFYYSGAETPFITAFVEGVIA